MVQKKKKKSIPKLPKIQKEVKDFMADDQGKMTRKDVAKLGVSLSVLGMMMQPGNSNAGSSQDQNYFKHTNVVGTDAQNCVTHTNVTEHIFSHYNHSDGGWMC